MKKLILTSAAVFTLVIAGFSQQDLVALTQYNIKVAERNDLNNSQELAYDIRGRYARPVKKGNLLKAKLLRDIVNGYPVNWISDYISVEILATANSKIMKTVSVNESLSPEQKNVLSNADLGTDIVVDVNYNYKNSVTDNIEIHTMHTSVTVVPEIEAEFTGKCKAEYAGEHDQMRKYLKENCINKISETIPIQFQHGIVVFTINEKGEAKNARISVSSGDSKMDKLLLEAINKMPKWKPAENSKGGKVKQEFEFTVGRGGC